jgi:abelson tyrosine-protein kinase 1/abelson tyrosine-protein kinase 2
MRPSLPPSQLLAGPLMNVIRLSWDQLPSNRPSFEQIAREIKKLRAERGTQGLSTPFCDSPQPPSILDQWGAQDSYHHHHSPDILPLPLPSGGSSTGREDSTFPVNSSSDLGYRGSALELDIGNDEARSESNVHAEQGREDFWGKGVTRSNSISTDTPSSEIYPDIPDQDWQGILASGFHTPPDPNTTTAKYQNERRYRMLLQHEYHTIRRVFIPIVALLCNQPTL